MSNKLSIIIFLLFIIAFKAQTGIGTTTPDASAKLDVSATNKGFLPPRMTMAQRNAISNPATGLQIFQTDGVVGLYVNIGTTSTPSWQLMAAPPTGSVTAYAGSSAPTGYLLCDGSAVSRTTYAALYAIIGTTYGSGDGSTTFNLPDLKGRVIVGVGTGSGLSTRALGAKGGEESHTQTINEMPSHTHNVYDPGHYHTTYIGRDDGNNSTNPGQAPPGDAGATTYGVNTYSAYTGISIYNNGGGNAFNVMQPYIVLNYIIKY